MKNNTILSVLNEGLCRGCGTCIALCPKNAIILTKTDKKDIFMPKLNLKNCSNCGICLNVCSGLGIDFKKLNLNVFGEEHKKSVIGTNVNCYTGYSKDIEIRLNSSSGGLVTQILIFALEKGIIDGALVTMMNRENPVEPESFIARTKEEVIGASKSKYCPVPANVALKEILNAPDNEKFAVVGLPCHIHGIRKAELINKRLKDKIIFHLGIFCHHGTNFDGTNFFIDRMNLDKNKITKLEYRGDGWPGNFKVILNDKEVKKDLFFFFFLFPSIYFFTPKRCFMCSDALNELADMSFGDAWLPRIQEKDNIGTSMIISRTKKGDQLLRKLKKEDNIELDFCKKSEVIESQRSAIYFKKKNLNARKRILDSLGMSFAWDNTYLMEPDVLDYVFAILIYIHNFLSSFKLIQKISILIPIMLIKGYHYLFYRFINSRNLLKK